MAPRGPKPFRESGHAAGEGNIMKYDITSCAAGRSQRHAYYGSKFRNSPE